MKAQSINAIVAFGPDGKANRVIELTEQEYNELERAMQWPEDLEAYDRLNSVLHISLDGRIVGTTLRGSKA
jgi:hypothetical protein